MKFYKKLNKNLNLTKAGDYLKHMILYNYFGFISTFKVRIRRLRLLFVR